MNNIKVKTPKGYLIVEEKGSEDEYPGVCISFSKDGKTVEPEIIACVEYITGDDEIVTEAYCIEEEYPVSMIVYEDGRDKCN